MTVAASPVRVQPHSVLATTYIPENPTIKGIFDTTGDWMQVSAAETPSDIGTITIDTTKSQVAIMAKKGATIIDQRGN